MIFKRQTGLIVLLKMYLLTTSVTVLFYMLTPFLTPSLPENRLQILFFFLSVAGALLTWRFLYISLISSPRFYKRVLVVGDSFDIKLISESLQKSDPNYFVVGYIHTDERFKTALPREDLLRFQVDELHEAIKKHHINEVLVASAYQKGLMLTLYNQLSDLLKKGFPIRDYTQVYEEITRRIPVQNVDKDFYRYFPFSRSNQNKFYLLVFRIFDILVSIIGIIFGIFICPFILIGNLLGNRGKLFYNQERVGKNGVIFKILKLRTMNKDAEVLGPQYAQKNDYRITKFGKFLRRCKIRRSPSVF